MPPAQLDDAQEPLSQASNRLLEIARDTARSAALTESDMPSQLSEFVQTYREWIMIERGALGTQQEQVLHWQMLVHCMISAATVVEAVDLLIRFSPVVWGDRAPREFRHEGDFAILVLREPFRPGSTGLIGAIWMLSLLLCALEFLADTRFSGAFGRVMHEPCLPDGVQHLLFDAPLEYHANELALVIPSRHLRRPVVARGANLPDFFARLMPLTLGARRGRADMRAMVSGLIRDDCQGTSETLADRANVAARLGLSETTMRRRLQAESTTFRAVKEAVHDALAKEWLVAGYLSIEQIAAKLGYSDSFAFRRSFQRTNGCSPAAYRRRMKLQR